MWHKDREKKCRLPESTSLDNVGNLFKPKDMVCTYVFARPRRHNVSVFSAILLCM